MGATQRECEALAAKLTQIFPAIQFNVEEGFTRGAYMIFVLSPTFEKPNLSSHLPSGWKADPWRNAEHRAVVCYIEKE